MVRGDTVQCDLADGELVFTHVAGEIPAPRAIGELGAGFRAARRAAPPSAPRTASTSGGLFISGAGAH